MAYLSYHNAYSKHEWKDGDHVNCEIRLAQQQRAEYRERLEVALEHGDKANAAHFASLLAGTAGEVEALRHIREKRFGE